MSSDRELITDSSPLESALINAYIDGRLTKQNRKDLELKIFRSEHLRDLLELRIKEKEKLQSLIVEKELDINMLSEIRSEILEINNNILQDQKVTFLKSIWNWLNKPFITIRF